MKQFACILVYNRCPHDCIRQSISCQTILDDHSDRFRETALYDLYKEFKQIYVDPMLQLLLMFEQLEEYASRHERARLTRAEITLQD
jgi:hypothetical protein